MDASLRTASVCLEFGSSHGRMRWRLPGGNCDGMDGGEGWMWWRWRLGGCGFEVGMG